MPLQQAVDTNGVPLTGATLNFFVTGTSTPATVYADVALTMPLGVSVEAQTNGQWPQIWLSPAQAYKVVLEDTNGVQIWTADPFGPAAGGASQNVAGILGEVRAFAGIASAIPAQWYLCYGQAVSRTTYANAFAVLGTAWGAGDNSTTFNIPDLRGRTLAGLDNMGGTAANRITAGVCGVPGTTLGGTGGGQNAQQDTLAANATSTVTDAGHTHAVVNVYQVGGGNLSASGNATAGFDNTSTVIAVTGITVATTVTVTSSLTGQTQNVQPTAMVNFIIYLGA